MNLCITSGEGGGSEVQLLLSSLVAFMRTQKVQFQGLLFDKGYMKHNRVLFGIRPTAWAPANFCAQENLFSMMQLSSTLIRGPWGTVQFTGEFRFSLNTYSRCIFIWRNQQSTTCLEIFQKETTMAAEVWWSEQEACWMNIQLFLLLAKVLWVVLDVRMISLYPMFVFSGIQLLKNTF